MQSQQRNLFDDMGQGESPWSSDEQRDQRVATVVFGEAPYGPFDYLVPDMLRGTVEPGRRLRVPLGRGDRFVVGYCIDVQPGSNEPRRLKAVATVVDSQPLLSRTMIALARWMADYYLCEIGQVLEGVIPAGVRGQAGTREVAMFSVTAEVAKTWQTLKLSEKQATVVQALAAAVQPLTLQQLQSAAKCTAGPIQTLCKKGIVQQHKQRTQVYDLDAATPVRESALHLNEDQRQALATIVAAVNESRHETILVHGVTGSGKTEVYIQAIERVVNLGRQAIVLVPEISLTPQTCQRFRSRFDEVAVLHSHLSDVDRHWHWQRIARGEVQVVVGARSAVFAPTPRLGLIVMDEEHDSSFKQDSAPRYHARDVAIERSRHENAPLVLGSATPSLESFYRAQQRTYRLVEMPRRVSNLPLPQVATIDLRTEFLDKTSRGAVSRQLHQAIDRAVKLGGQVILLLNRRGFSTSIQCPACGYVAKCPDCDLALTHHIEGGKAICHYCDFQMPAPTRCPDCKFDGIRYAGLGTQKLEAEIAARFPKVPLLRMDTDTMQKPGSHEEAFARFRAGDVKILLGTQMIAKGLDFPNVTLVGVINADTALHFPDFRASERTFQLVTQVAGRTGRSSKGGIVLVQTSSPGHPAIEAAVRHDYALFASRELPTREQFGYPPLSSMLRFIVRGPNETHVEQFAELISDRIREIAAATGIELRVLGPAPCPIAKIRGKSRFHTLIHGTENEKMRATFREAVKHQKPPTNVQWAIDVDPVDML